jgi:putative redox protein
MNKIILDRVTGDFGFDAKDESGHIVKIDGAESIGGMGSGARPMQLLLMGLGGCSGIDIVSILKKQRQVVEDLSIKIVGEREKDKIPSLWKSVEMIFAFKGNIDEAKAQRACELSMEKHCSVAETLRLGGTEIKWSFTINNTL